MGSEHYCLRWNNHQSNLLGVFSQLLQDESLVDVTLSCSEGAPIRAHKVVLSACSSYFQSLFLDHPEKHPIVILKDVRFAELQTLVEFMYKGEVNVQYCQLSALLKTAESLKVKGLAEMTNQNTTLREPEREPERLRPHSQPCKSSNSSCDSPVDATLSGPSTSASNIGTSSQHSAASTAAPSIGTAATTPINAASSTSATTNATSTTVAAAAATSSAIASSLSSKRSGSTSTSNEQSATERCSPSPPKRIHVKSAASIQEHRGSPQPLDLYQRRLEHQQEDTKENSILNNDNAAATSAATATTTSLANDRARSTPPHSAGSGTTAKHHCRDGNGDDDMVMKHEDPDRDTGREGGEEGECSYHSPDRLGAIDVHRGLTRDCDDSVVEKIEDVEDVDYGDEEMDLDDDGDNSSDDVAGLNMKIHSSSLAAALVSPNLRSGLESSLCALGGVRERDRDLEAGDSARSTPLTASTALALDSHSHRPASRSSRDGSCLDQPSSRGGHSGLPSTSATSLAGGLSPGSSTAAALGLVADTLAGPSGLGPVQSVPLSLKKEIDCSEDDNSNSRHLQPRSASASGILGGELDYRTSHESETSDSPHGLGAGIANAGGCSGSGSSSVGGPGGGGIGGGGSSLCPSASSAVNTAPSFTQDHPRTSPSYSCVYCHASFPTQNKLTRHILSHSLKTLEYRETATHALLHPHLLPHDLNMPPLAYQMNAAMAATAGGDPQEQAAAMAAAVAMDMDFAAAIAAAGGCAFPSLTGCTTRGLDLDGSGSAGGGGGSSSSGRCRDSRVGRAGLDDDSRTSSGNGGCPGSSLSLLSGAGSSTSAAAAVAAAAASSATSSNDPNNVLCKFCGKSFPDVTSLIQHLPVHTGDRPFKCEFCGKAFKLRHHMKDHCRVHTGERPFRCQMCGKTFSRSTILKAHEKTHFPKYTRKYLTPSPVDTKDEMPQ